MIAEPYIFTSGRRAGRLTWLSGQPCSGRCSEGCVNCDKGAIEPYADFEREKVKKLGYDFILVNANGFFTVHAGDPSKWSLRLIGYGHKVQDDSESSRVIKRAEFLKAVCEREGVEWLPQA